MEEKRIWITWENQRRNKTLSQELNAELFEIVIKRGRLIRYVVSIFHTMNVVVKKNPDVLFVQNPSLVLTLLSISIKHLFGFRLIVDEHNSGLFPLEGKSRLLNWVARLAARKADFAIVTNTSLANIVENWGGRPLVLPDPLPSQIIKNTPIALDSGPFKVFFICTWSKDEPFLEVLEAARDLGGDFKISISGNWKGKIEQNVVPQNVHLTGFLSDADYVAALEGASAVLVLTTRDHCLNCGAYEAVAAEKPLILSNKEEIRRYFSRGVVYAENEAISIRQSLEDARKNYDELKRGIAELKTQLSHQWVFQKHSVESAIVTKVLGS